MPTLKFPLIASYNQRSFAAVGVKDQFVKGAILTVIKNKQFGTPTFYTEKRTGVSSEHTLTGGVTGVGFYYSPSTVKIYSLTSDSGNQPYLFENSTNCGAVGPTSVQASYFSEILLNGITFILISAASSDHAGTGWFLASDAVATTAYTADGNNSTTITDIKVAGVPSVAGLYVGQKLSAASNIVSGSRILSINAGAFSAVLDTATTGGAFNDLAITKEPVAKITDSDFPTDIVGGFACLNGYANIMTYRGRVYQSDLNSVISWTSTNYLTCDKNPGVGIGCYKNKDRVVAFTSGGYEILYNAGNASGSTMSSGEGAVASTSLVPYFGNSVTSINGRLYWLGLDRNIHSLDSSGKLSTAGTSVDVTASIVTAFSYMKKDYLSISGQTYSAGTVKNYWYGIDDDTFVESGISAVKVFHEYSGDSSGKVYTLRTTGGLGNAVLSMIDASTATFQDLGSTLTMSIQIGTDMGTDKRKQATELRVEADNQSSGTLDISYSDDDGVTYTTARSIPLNGTRKFLSRLGSWLGTRLWKFEHSANAPFRGQKVEIDYEILG